ncbi:NADH-quinone oxidoreductase subunit E [Pararhodobacter aggregans]|uniref:NADH-quinone oxidoreductase subunit E n=1 Tax=Pararhodobacter aggregans TaxID=404875 RepID=A0A2T7UL30_9RHOB|nr:NADH-quinone oxidoreductase subunit E [Pararhodobacter aggregans]PTX05399.1 NADH dehydrogenase subunit E [Pararhodobacter aggregans]PVE45359.1 NADH-quinone oxidoreductase subunit E [Pararhodobacter aggregans]
MLRRLHHEQPASFAFTPANLAWAKGQITKYPEGRQASAIIPLLWRAQEQEGWLTRPAIEAVADMLGMAYIRALEVATFYFMFQLAPVGTVAHVQVCGTTSCLICGAEDLIGVCKDKIAGSAHTLSADGKFSWEEVECLGSCANAPMVQIGKDYYEDLTAEKLRWILDELAAGRVPTPGPQNGRFTSEPLSGLTSLTEGERSEKANGSVARALALGDTVKRIDGTEVPLLTPWLKDEKPRAETRADGKPVSSRLGKVPADKAADIEANATIPAEKAGQPPAQPEAAAAAVQPKATETAEIPESEQVRPEALQAARDGKADDLKRIKGIGPKLEAMLNGMGFFHFDQIAAWTPQEMAWVDQNLEGFKGRATRDQWVAQAKLLATGQETDFSKRVDKGDVY